MKKVIVNFSGGVDSTAAVMEAMKRYPKDEIMLCFQNTGAEYLETESHVEDIASILGLKLVILKPKRDWFEQVRHDKFFFTPALRKCTFRLKIDLFNSWLSKNRQELGDDIVIVSGIRGEESVLRASKAEWEKNGHGVGWLWRPCLYMSKAEIFGRIRAEGLPIHSCYEFSGRCNCWLCMFAGYNEVRTYAELHPELWEKACLLEDEIGRKWKQKFAINDLMKQGRLFDLTPIYGCPAGIY